MRQLPPRQDGLSWITYLASQSVSKQNKILDWIEHDLGIHPEELKYLWSFHARPSQFEPTSDYFVWLILAGRGFGKTRTAVETVYSWINGPTPLEAAPGAPEILTIVADTPSDMKRFTVEGPSGFLNVSRPDYRPAYYPSNRTLVFPNGVVAYLYSSEDPDSLRGASGSRFWIDELAKAQYADLVWSNLMLGMREGDPKGLITTTPQPKEIIIEIAESPTTVVTRGSSFENKANLAKKFVDDVLKPLQGTRTGRQEIEAEILMDFPGALWTLDQFDRGVRLKADDLPDIEDMKRIVVAVDPSGTAGKNEARSKKRVKEESNDVGIVIAGLDKNDIGYIIADRTANVSPAEWGSISVRSFKEFKADKIVAERNFGGEMVRHVIRTVDPNVDCKLVSASRGKTVRAEPIATLYEQGRVKHFPGLDKLEDQMTRMTTDGYQGRGSPDRVDAMVWAMTELMLNNSSGSVDHFFPEAVF